MISIYREEICDIPCLVVVPEEKKQEALPLVIYYHGFNGEKEASLTIAYKLAEKNLRVVLPDSLYHGERAESISQTKKELAFWQIVIQNVEEVKYVYEHFHGKNLILNDQVGFAGTSMGGITTYGAICAYDWIKVAVVNMGTPNISAYANQLIDHVNTKAPNTVNDALRNEALQLIRPYDLTLHPEELADVALLAWHGEKDNVIPINQSKDFFKHIATKENHRFVKEANRMHHVSRLAIKETLQWFDKYLS